MHVHRTFKPLLLSAIVGGALLAGCSESADPAAAPAPASTETTSAAKSEMKYPSFAEVEVSDKYGDVSVADPFRGLEEIDSEATKTWIAQQNELTKSVLDKLSLQFALHETGRESDVLEAYERLIHDAMSGDHTLFTTAEGIERLWELSSPLLESPPPVRSYAPGSWGPNAIHQLIAPHAWRLPFERAWRTKPQ